MQLREVKDFEDKDTKYYLKPSDYGYMALAIAIKHKVSCKQAFTILDKELKSKNYNFHNTNSRGW